MSSARLLKSEVASHVTHFFSSLHRIRFYRRHHHHHKFRLYWLEHRNSSPIRLVVVSKSVHHYGSSQALFCKTASDWGIYSWSLIGWMVLCLWLLIRCFILYAFWVIGSHCIKKCLTTITNNNKIYSHFSGCILMLKTLTFQDVFAKILRFDGWV